MPIFPMDDPAYANVYAEESAMVDASELIADALEDSGLSQAALARALGVSRSEITARLRGERNITVRSLAATLHALGRQVEFKSVAEPTSDRSRSYQNWHVPSEESGHVEVIRADSSRWIETRSTAVRAIH